MNRRVAVKASFKAIKIGLLAAAVLLAAVNPSLALDACLPGLSGLELQAALAGSPRAHPIVIMTGTGDIKALYRAVPPGISTHSSFRIPLGPPSGY